MPAINAVYSRNNLTMFSTSIVQASRGLFKQALNAVYSQLNHFRTSLTVMPLCWGAASLFFFLFSLSLLSFRGISFYFLFICVPVNQTFYVSLSNPLIVETADSCSVTSWTSFLALLVDDCDSRRPFDRRCSHSRAVISRPTEDFARLPSTWTTEKKALLALVRTMLNVASYRLWTAGCRIRAAPRANVVAMLETRIPTLCLAVDLTRSVTVINPVIRTPCVRIGVCYQSYYVNKWGI